MRTLSILALSAATLLSPPAFAQYQANSGSQAQRPFTSNGSGEGIYNFYQFMRDDRARMADGRYKAMMQAAQDNMDAFASLRAREGRGPQPRR